MSLDSGLEPVPQSTGLGRALTSPPYRTGYELPAISALLAICAVAAHLAAPVPIRTAIVLAFLALGPGLALLQFFDFRDVIVTLTLAVAISLASASLLAALSLYAGLWSPDAVFAVLIGWTGVASAIRLGLLWRGSRDQISSLAIDRASGRTPASALSSEVEKTSLAQSHGAGNGQETAVAVADSGVRLHIFPTNLTDEEWRLVSMLLPTDEPVQEYDPRDLCDAILYVKQHGIAWRELPSDFPPENHVRRYYSALELNGTWRVIAAALRALRLQDEQFGIASEGRADELPQLDAPIRKRREERRKPGHARNRSNGTARSRRSTRVGAAGNHEQRFD